MEPQMYGHDQSWMGSCDGQFLPKIVQRRAKRSIPDNDKDDKYWEKRKRNNMAAKRSRECKRQAETDIRNKVSFLEEENALLRKEISLMKAKFGIPPEQSILSQEDRTQCMHDVRSNRQLTDNGAKSESEDGSDSSMMSPTGARYSLGGMSKSVSPYGDRMNGEIRRQQGVQRHKGADMNGGNGYEVYASWSQLPAEASYINAQMYQNGEGKYPPSTPQEFMDKHAMFSNYERYVAEEGQTNPRAGYQYYGYQHQLMYPGSTSVHTPADLTLNRKSDERTRDECPEFMDKSELNGSISVNSSPLKLPIKPEYYSEEKAMLLKHSAQLADSTTNNASHHSNQPNSPDGEFYGNDGVNLKAKLQHLSSHFNELKK
ncbi:hypothetical protein SNE40_014987 [Patella caerulea]|uniref:BZIP domain-containing protein n=2 Tax=Patella caerulea TaxID=87958 RepID=A0AAN8JEQ6_PATCE